MEKDNPKARSAWRWWLAGAAAVLMLLLLAAGAWYWLAGEKVWTDDRAIRLSDSQANLRKVLWARPQALEAKLNTADQEYEPSASSDGSELYFVRGLPGKGADIYVSFRRNNAWSEPVAFAAVNTQYDELGPRLTPDGRFLLFYSNRPGGQGLYDIWASERTQEGWGKGFNLGPAVNSEYNEYGPACDLEGRLYFASNRKSASKTQKHAWRATIREGVTGDYDLFVAEPLRGGGEAPQAPGEAPAPSTMPAGAAAEKPALAFGPARELEGVNTPYHEGACCITPGGDFLYFASDRPGGVGGFDLYRCRLRDGKCGEVENLGLELNTPNNETDPQLAMAGFQMYFSSDRTESRGGYDLFMSESREVYAQRQGRPAPQLAWSWWVLLAAMVVLIPALLFLRAGGYTHLRLLQKCLFVSLLVHVVITTLLSMFFLTQEVMEFVAREAGMTVAVNLEVGREVEIGLETRQQITDLPMANPSVADLARVEETAVPRAAPQPEEINVPRVRYQPAAMTVQPEAPTRMPPQPTEQISLPAPPVLAEKPSIQFTPPAPLAEAEARPEPKPTEIAEVRPAVAPLVAVRPSHIILRTDQASPKAESLAQVAKPEPPRPVAVEQPAAELRLGEPPAPTVAGPQLQAAPVTSKEPETPVAAAPAAQVKRVEAGPETPQAAAETRLSPGRANVPRESLAQANMTAREAAAQPAERPAPPAEPVLLVQVSVSGPVFQGEKVASRPPGSVVVPDAPIQPQPVRTASPRGGAAATEVALPAAQVIGRSLLAAASANEARVAEVPRPAMDIPVASESVSVVLPVLAAGRQADRENPLVATAVAPPRPMEARPISPEAPERPTELVKSSATVAATPAAAVSLANQPLSQVRQPRAAEVIGERVVPQATVAPLSGSLGPGRLKSPPSLFQRSFEQRQKLINQLGGSKESETAVGRALVYLSRTQEQDGRWTMVSDRHKPRADRHEIDVSVTGLAALSFLAADHTPARESPYREVVQKAMDFLLKQQKPDGDLRGSGGQMYNHAIATLALAEAALMTGDATYRQSAIKAAEFIFKAQNR